MPGGTGDFSTDARNEILRTRDTQFAAHSTQPLDNTTLLIAEVKRVRDLTLQAVAANQDSITVCEANWDGVRAT